MILKISSLFIELNLFFSHFIKKSVEAKKNIRPLIWSLAQIAEYLKEGNKNIDKENKKIIFSFECGNFNFKLK